MGIRQESEGGGKVFTRERHGYGFVGGGAVFVPFSGRCSLVTFFGGRTRSTQRVLHKEEKQVIGRKAVIRDGVGDHRRPVTRLRTAQDPVIAANSLSNCRHDHQKQKVSRVLEEVFGGSDRAYRQVSDRREKVL